MRAKSILYFRAIKKNIDQATSYEASLFAFKLLGILSEFDEIFRIVYYYHAEKEERFVVREKEYERLSKLMVFKEWKEINDLEGVSNPTIHYQRKSGGFSSWFAVKVDSSRAFDVVISYGYKTNGISLHHFNKNIHFDYSWYERLFNILVNSDNWLYASIAVSYPGMQELYDEFEIKYPLGWLTYYSNELSIDVPEMPGVTTTPFYHGVVMKTDEGDFLADKETFDAYKARLRHLLEIFKKANGQDE